MPLAWKHRRPTVKSLLFAMIVMVSVITFPSCGRAEPSQPDTANSIATPSPTPIDPKALLEESGIAMSSLDSFHFVLEHEDGGTPLADNLTLIRAEGDIIRPDKISVDFSASAGGFAVKSSLISIGSVSYMTNPLNGEWAEVSQEVSPLGFFDPQKGIASIMSRVDEPNLTSINSKTYNVTGSLPTEALIPLFGITLEGELVDVEVVMNLENLQLLKATLTGKITPNEPNGLVRVIRLSNFDEISSIEPPMAR